jgi:hypothetical protein
MAISSSKKLGIVQNIRSNQQTRLTTMKKNKPSFQGSINHIDLIQKQNRTSNKAKRLANDVTYDYFKRGK